MDEEIKEDVNFIVKAFENDKISILKENVNDKKIYYFKANDIGKALNLTNIHASIQHYKEKEKVLKPIEDLKGNIQNTVFLTSKGVYRLLYRSDKPLAEKFREWVGDILDDIIFNESKELTKKLKEQELKIKELDINNTEQQKRIELLTKKTNKFKLGESLYIFESTVQEKIFYKIGRTKNANQRDKTHKTSSFGGISYQMKCVNSALLEKTVHFLLDKYRCSSRREWFDTKLSIIKNALYYAKIVIESEINLENDSLLDSTEKFIESQKVNNVKECKQIIKGIEEAQSNILTTLDFVPKNINDFELFISECLEIGEDLYEKNTTLRKGDYISYFEIKNQYKIWAKTANRFQLKKLIEFLQTKFKTVMMRYNPLVTSSKNSQHFTGIKLKAELLKFENPKDDNKIIEKFLFEKCQRAPGFRIKMQDLFTEFEKFYETNEYKKLSYVCKEKVKKYLDIVFIRLKTGDESEKKDMRLSAWLGLALKNEKCPEPKHNYNRNNKSVQQMDVLNNKVVKKWDSIESVAEYLNKSTTVTSGIISRNEQIEIDKVNYLFIKID